MVQSYNLPQINSDYLKTEADYLLCQNGTVPKPSLPFDPVKRYINTPRDLAEYVHNDTMCQAFYNGHLILNTLKAPPNPGSPYKTQIKNEAPFVTMGPPDIQDLIHRASRTALHACWLQKVLYLHIRPEVYGYEVNRAKNGNNYGIHSDVLNSSTLARIFSKFEYSKASVASFFSKFSNEKQIILPDLALAEACCSREICSLFVYVQEPFSLISIFAVLIKRMTLLGFITILFLSSKPAIDCLSSRI